MSDNLNVALEKLRQRIAEAGDAPLVIAHADLERAFHGLTLRQLVLLVDAPALGSFAELRSPEGARIEQFLIDGKDTQRCEALARDILLGDAALAAGDVREVRILGNGLDGHVLLRDHNNIVYRVTDREAAIDQLLTNALQQRRRAQQTEQRAEAGAAGRAMIVIDGAAFAGVAGEILHGLAAIRARNGIALQEVDRLLKASGQRNLASAVSVVGPEALAASLSRTALAAQQIEALLEALRQRMQALLQAAETAKRGPDEPIAEAGREQPSALTDAPTPAGGAVSGPFPGIRAISPEAS